MSQQKTNYWLLAKLSGWVVLLLVLFVLSMNTSRLNSEVDSLNKRLISLNELRTSIAKNSDKQHEANLERIKAIRELKSERLGDLQAHAALESKVENMVSKYNAQSRVLQQLIAGLENYPTMVKYVTDTRERMNTLERATEENHKIATGTAQNAVNIASQYRALVKNLEQRMDYTQATLRQYGKVISHHHTESQPVSDNGGLIFE